MLLYIFILCVQLGIYEQTNGGAISRQSKGKKKTQKTSKTFGHRLCLLDLDSSLSFLSLSLSSYLWTSLSLPFFGIVVCFPAQVSVMFSTMRSDHKV